MRRSHHLATVLLLLAASLGHARTALTPTPTRDKANLQLGEVGHLVNETITVGLN